jgi:hypothetical protein
METLLYTSLLHCPYAFESEWHCCITECVEQSDERCLDLIFDFEGNLIIPQVAIQKS